MVEEVNIPNLAESKLYDPAESSQAGCCHGNDIKDGEILLKHKVTGVNSWFGADVP